jgi:predicted DNA-binding ribbon-helix-helix protein
MKSTGNRKRSVIIMNKRTSVCLEDSFWMSLHAIVQMERTTIEAFIESVKQEHDPRNLSSSLRVAILEYFQRIAVRDASVRSEMAQLQTSCGTRTDDMPIGNHRELRDKVVAFWSGVRRNDMMFAK